MQFDRRGCAIGLLTNAVVSGFVVGRNFKKLSTAIGSPGSTGKNKDWNTEKALLILSRPPGQYPGALLHVFALPLARIQGSGIFVEYLKRWKTPVVMLTAERVSLLRETNPFY